MSRRQLEKSVDKFVASESDETSCQEKSVLKPAKFQYVLPYEKNQDHLAYCLSSAAYPALDDAFKGEGDSEIASETQVKDKAMSHRLQSQEATNEGCQIIVSSLRDALPVIERPLRVKGVHESMVERERYGRRWDRSEGHDGYGEASRDRSSRSRSRDLGRSSRRSIDERSDAGRRHRRQDKCKPRQLQLRSPSPD